MKKFVSLMLAVLFICTMTINAFAAPATGSITINGVNADTDYAVYRLLELVTFDKAAGAYSYKIDSAWATFFATEGKDYIAVDNGYVTWNAADDDTTMAAFAQMALAYAKANGIAPVQDTEDMAVSGNAGVFSNLEWGWYLVDSTAGALCGLTSTDPDASINAKNNTPIIDKQVQEDLTGMWGDTNTADIGQIVEFMTIIHATAGAENYVMHDRMSDGLTFEQDPDNGRGVHKIVKVNSLGVETILAVGTDYAVTTDPCTDADDECPFGADCDLQVVFTKEFVASLHANDRILVYYNAMLNRDAVIAGTGNKNEVSLEYGEEHYTVVDETKTYTFSIDIVKTDGSNKLIDGAKFRIYDAFEGGNEIAVVPLMESDEVTPVLDANGNPMYRRARTNETGVEIEVKDGQVTVVGFDNGVYYLEETKAPDGYNMLSARQEFTIADANLDSVFNGGIFSTGSGVHVVNRTGNMMPETGGVGTVIFVTIGALAVLAAGVLLVTKKRMGMIRE